MPSNVDEQPPSQPPRPRPEAPRRRPPSRAEARAAQRRSAPPVRAGARRAAAQAGPPAPPSRRPVDDDSDSDGAPAPKRQTRLVVVLSIVTVVVIGLIGFAVVQTTKSSSDDIPPAASGETPIPTTTFKDAQTGFTVAYPRSWKKVDVPVAEYRLAVDGGNNVAFTIRVVPIQVPATAANLVNFKAVTDGLVASNATVNVLKEQAIQLNGMLGYYYFYSFTDGVVQAVHAHYFLFSGNKMNIIVFQTLPDDFQAMAATFDKIAESFRSDANVPSAATVPAPSTTTTIK